MIRILKHLECGAVTQLFAERFDERQVGEIVTSSLQEQHRNVHVEEVLGAFFRWLSRRMKRKSKKHEAAHVGQRRCGLRLRSHPAAKGFATGEQCKVWNYA
jgi:hypothetical protein